MRHAINFLFILFFVSILFSCIETPYRFYLDKAESLLEEYPDSAFNFLDLIISPELLSEEDFHRYVLLQIQSKQKTRQDVSKDTTIFNLRGYYDKSDFKKAVLTYLYSGSVYESQGRFNEALTDYLSAEKLAIHLDLNLKAKIQHFIGSLFFSRGEINESKIRFKLALENYNRCADFKNLISTYNMIGNCYLLEQEVDSAQVYYQICVDLLKDIDNYLDRALLLNNLAVGYNALGDTLKAKQFMNEAFGYPISDKERSKITYNLAKINIHNEDSFYFYMNKSFDLLKEEDIDLRKVFYSTYSKFEEQQEAYKVALDYNKKYIQYLKEVYERDYEISLNKLQQKFYLKSFEQENMQLTIRAQQLFIFGCIFVILLLVAICYIFRQRKLLGDAERNVEDLIKMSEQYNEQEESLKNVVLKDFNLLKKVALLENYMLSNDTNRKFIKKINEILYEQDTLDWERLYETMNSLYHNLFNKIREEFPVLNQYEFRVCCLTIARLSNSEIGIIMNNSGTTVQSRKTYIRKKLGIPHQGNIRNFFLEYFDYPASTGL